MNQSFVRKNENLLSRIVSGYVPALELSRDLLQIVDTIHLNFQNAVASKDLDKLETGNSQRQKFNEFIEAEKKNPVLRSEELVQLEKNFSIYYEFAYETSEKLIKGENVKALTTSLESMNSYFSQLKETLNVNIRKGNKNLAMSFGLTRNNNRIMTVVGSLTTVFGILIISFLSWFVVKSISQSLGIAIHVAEKVAGGDLTVEVPSNGVHDEPGQLLKSFHGMVNNLRDLTNQIKEGAQALSVSSGQISTSVTEIAAGATETATAASQTSTTVEEVRQTALDSNKKAKLVSESAQKAVLVSQC
jgi:methyl-accepting chemotaxis protein